MKVVCIKAASRVAYSGSHPSIVGRIYTVREVYVCPALGTLGLRFEEHINPVHPMYGIECGYSAERFRPVVERKTDISIFTQMLNPSKVEANA